MRIDTVATLEDIKNEHIDNRTVIVIDVLRASSTIVTALESGFTSVIPVKTKTEALAMRSLNSIVAGEWHGKKLRDLIIRGCSKSHQMISYESRRWLVFSVLM